MDGFTVPSPKNIVILGERWTEPGMIRIFLPNGEPTSGSWTVAQGQWHEGYKVYHIHSFQHLIPIFLKDQSGKPIPQGLWSATASPGSWTAKWFHLSIQKLPSSASARIAKGPKTEANFRNTMPGRNINISNGCSRSPISYIQYMPKRVSSTIPMENMSV